MARISSDGSGLQINCSPWFLLLRQHSSPRQSYLAATTTCSGTPLDAEELYESSRSRQRALTNAVQPHRTDGLTSSSRQDVFAQEDVCRSTTSSTRRRATRLVARPEGATRDGAERTACRRVKTMDLTSFEVGRGGGFSIADSEEKSTRCGARGTRHRARLHGRSRRPGHGVASHGARRRARALRRHLVARQVRRALGARNIFSKLCQAAAYMHARNIIHRDVKPENVLGHRY